MLHMKPPIHPIINQPHSKKPRNNINTYLFLINSFIFMNYVTRLFIITYLKLKCIKCTGRSK